jgi:hypothetical protein
MERAFVHLVTMAMLANAVSNVKMTVPEMVSVTMVNASVILHGLEMIALYLYVVRVKFLTLRILTQQ